MEMTKAGPPVQRAFKLTVLAVLLLAVAVAVVSSKIYVLRDYGGGFLLWNGNEAYLFMDISRRGFQITYMEYPWVVLKELLYGVREPDNQRTSVTVVHITPSGVERYVLPAEDEQQANTPDLYKVVEDHIYANYHGHAYKWTGSEFERATEEEQHRYDETNQVIAGDVEKYRGGWSQRGVGGSDYAADVGGKFTLQVKDKVMREGGAGILSIVLIRPGQGLEEIYHLDQHPRRVGKTEYTAVFARR